MGPLSFDRDRFRALPLIGILRGYEPSAVRHAVEAALRGGLTTVEIAMNSPGAVRLLQTARLAARGRADVGAGTVRTLGALETALAAGAEFVITPVVAIDVIEACVARRVPVFAGAFTPTEVERAWQRGATMVKLFPASQLGPGYVAELKAPLDDVPLLPTGGVGVDDVAPYLAAGADGFGIGGGLFARSRIEAGAFDAVEEAARRYVEAYRRARGGTSR